MKRAPPKYLLMSEKLLSSDGRGRGYIECVRGHITRKWKNFISLHIDMPKKESADTAERALPSSPKITELLAHGRSTSSEIAYATVRPSRLLLQN